MIFLDWDEAKRVANIRKHNIDFADLLEVFESETATDVDNRFDYAEPRFRSLGLFLGKVITVIHTETIIGADTFIRLISARRADKYEQEYYFKNIRD